MKRSKLIILIITIILLLIVIIWVYKNIKNNKETIYSEEKIQLLNAKADTLFGLGNCTNERCNIVTDDFNEKECELCSTKFTGSSSIVLCDKCRSELGRCDICGKKNRD